MLILPWAWCLPYLEHGSNLNFSILLWPYMAPLVEHCAMVLCRCCGAHCSPLRPISHSWENGIAQSGGGGEASLACKWTNCKRPKGGFWAELMRQVCVMVDIHSVQYSYCPYILYTSIKSGKYSCYKEKYFFSQIASSSRRVLFLTDSISLQKSSFSHR